MATLGLGVIGLGRMGQVYATFAAASIQGAELVAVADARPDVIQQFGSHFSKLATYTDYHDLLANPAVGAVIIATPTHTHRDLVIAAAEAGKAIFCEKPTALTLEATDEMIAAVEKADAFFQVGFMRRFDAGYANAKRQVEMGVIGTPVTIRSIGRDPFPTSLEYANPAVSGGLILDMGIHDFDLLRWYMGVEVERVYAEAASLVYPELLTVGDVDNAMISLRFENGALGNVEVSRTAAYGYDIQCTIIGTTGTLQIGYLQETPVLTLTRDGARHDVVPHFPQRFGAAYTAQIAAFAACVQEGQPPPVTAQHARAALAIGLAATRSQHEERIVYLREFTT